MGAQRTQRPWRRRQNVDPAQSVRNELTRRELRDLKTCQQVWEYGDDPLALCEAVRLLEGTIPEWLVSALLLALTDSAEQAPRLPAAWRARTRASTIATRAWAVAVLRAHPTLGFSWVKAAELAPYLANEKYPDIPIVSTSGGKAAYSEVRRQLTERPYAFFRPRPGLQDRLVKALDYRINIIEQRLTRARERQAPRKTKSSQKRPRKK